MPDYNALSPKGLLDPITPTDWSNLAGDLQLHQNVTTLRPTNNTGGTVTRGYVGVLDEAVSNSLIAASGVADRRRVVVVQDATVPATGLVYCQVSGRVAAINITGAVDLYAPLETSATAGRAQQGESAPFAIALEAFAGPGTGQIQALLLPPIAGASFPIGDPSGTHGPWSFHLTGTSVNHLVTTPGANISIYVTSIRVIQNNTTPCIFTANDTTGPTHTETIPVPGVAGFGVETRFDPPWKIGANEGLDIIQSAAGDLYGSVNGYTAAG